MGRGMGCEIREWWTERGGRRIDLIARLDAVEREPVEICLERVGDLVAVAARARQLASGTFGSPGFMSWISRITPSLSMNATESGMSVFFIQNVAVVDRGQKENHAVVVAQVGAEHQAPLLLRAGGGDLGRAARPCRCAA